MPHINWKSWLYFGALYGLTWALIVTVATVIGLTSLLALVPGISQFTLGTALVFPAVLALLIILPLYSAFEVAIGRLLTQYIGWFSKKKFQKLLQVFFIGHLVTTLAVLLLSGASIATALPAFLVSVLFSAVLISVGIYLAEHLAPKIGVRVPIE